MTFYENLPKWEITKEYTSPRKLRQRYRKCLQQRYSSDVFGMSVEYVKDARYAWLSRRIAHRSTQSFVFFVSNFVTSILPALFLQLLSRFFKSDIFFSYATKPKLAVVGSSHLNGQFSLQPYSNGMQNISRTAIFCVKSMWCILSLENIEIPSSSWHLFTPVSTVPQ